MNQKNYYEILGVSKKATKDEITAAKNKLAKQYHPDSNQQFGIDTTHKMQEILEAYQTLSDDSKRRAYDRQISSEKRHEATMQNFDFSQMDTENVQGTFIEYWQAADRLFRIVEKSSSYSKRKNNRETMRELSKESIHDILILKSGCIPVEYWHPSVMNWILLQWYQNQRLSTKYLLSLYDEHLKKDYKTLERMQLKRSAAKYEKQLKQLLKYV